MPRLVNIKGLREFVALSESQVRLAYKHGGMPHVRVGGRVLFDPEEVVEWAKAGGAGDLARVRADKYGPPTPGGRAAKLVGDA